MRIYILSILLILAGCGKKEEIPKYTPPGNTQTTENKNSETTANQNVKSPAEGKTYYEIMNIMMNNIKEQKRSGDINKDYANLMKEFLMGAVILSENYLKSGTDTVLRNTAIDIINHERGAHEEIFFWENSPDFSKSQITGASGPFYTKADEDIQNIIAQFDEIKGTSSNNINRDFVLNMKVHHQGGINLSKTYKENANDSTLTGVSNRLVNFELTQNKKFDRWLTGN